MLALGGWTNGWIGGQTDGQMDVWGWMGGVDGEQVLAAWLVVWLGETLLGPRGFSTLVEKGARSRAGSDAVRKARGSGAL